MTYTDEDVERVALKICEAVGDWNPVPMNKMAYEDAARAAIAAMREPTKEMEAMGWAYHSEIGRMELPAAYTRMIDAALECSTKSDGK